MAAKKHPEVIEGRWRLIAVDVLDSEEAAEDDSIYHGDAALDEEDGSGSIGAGIIEEVGDMQEALKYSYLLSYMMKPSHLLTQGFGNNSIEHDNIFKHMFTSRVEGEKNSCQFLS